MICSFNPYIFTILLQILIETITIATLYIKYYFENHPRILNIFYKDAGKQVVLNTYNLITNYILAYWFWSTP